MTRVDDLVKTPASRSNDATEQEAVPTNDMGGATMTGETRAVARLGGVSMTGESGAVAGLGGTTITGETRAVAGLGGVSRPVSEADENDDFLFTAFKKLKVDPQWSEDSIVNDVSTKALSDLWAGKTVKSRVRSKHRGLRSRKKHGKTARLPYAIDSLPSMDKLTLSREHCSCSSCKHCDDAQTLKHSAFGSVIDLVNTKSILREARLKLHNREKDQRNVIWKAKLKLKRNEPKSPPGATNAFIPETVFGAKSNVNSFDTFGAKCVEALPRLTVSSPTAAFESRPVFSNSDDHSDESCDSLSEVTSRLSVSSANKRPRPVAQSRLHRTCSQEAKLDEMTVEELAGYLEDFMYIPKNMSEMAEGMYT